MPEPIDWQAKAQEWRDAGEPDWKVFLAEHAEDIALQMALTEQAEMFAELRPPQVDVAGIVYYPITGSTADDRETEESPC